MIVGGKVSEVESSMDACASDTRASGGDCVDRFSKVLKCSCHLAATDALSDSSFPSSAFNGADEVAHFCFSCRNETKSSLISPHRRWLSPVVATCSIHCCLSCLSDLNRGPVRHLYSSTFPIRIACLCWSIIARVAWDIHGLIIIIIISKTTFMVLSSWQSHYESSPGSFDECRTAPSGRRPKTKPDDLGCESACTFCQSLHSPSPFIIITQPESWNSFYHPTESRRLSRPSWLVTYRDGLLIYRWSPILVLTGSDIAQLRWSRPMRYH